ncbi:hypothetical protein BDV95DRAFT_463201, partial [Massariosphaeria phaeospora]
MPTTSQLPPDHNLCVTTPSAIYFHTSSTRRRLFQCATPEGILNARAAKDNSGLLAVADSQLVILFDAARGRDREYRLKSGDGEPRLLLFSPSSCVLYFTTSLSTSIQAYSIASAELLPPTQVHLSPPSVLAISTDGNILLSASPTPPMILMQDLRGGSGSPVNFQSGDSRSPVTCAAFQAHDSFSHVPHFVFMLGFQDGTLALYRVTLPTLSRPHGESYLFQAQAYQLQPTRIGAIKKLHKAAMGGITAAEFMPGYKARVVSIGHDGRCRLYVAGSALCLAVATTATTAPFASRGRKDKTVFLDGGSTEGHDQVYQGVETLIAVGTQAGKVSVFNTLGLLVHEVEMEMPVLAIEWVGDMSAPSLLANRHASSSSPPEPHPVLDLLMGEYENAAAEECGTVRKTPSPTKGAGIGSPVPLARTKDLFSLDHPRRASTRLVQQPPANPSSPPPPPDETQSRPRRKSYLRPRIATETFRDPK